MTYTLTPHIVAFTGHRSYNRLHDAALLSCIEKLVAQGARRFRVGMAEGFDMAAAFAVLSLRRNNPDIALDLYIPYPDFGNRLSGLERRLYDILLSEANYFEYIASEYHTGVYQERNKALVNGANIVVAWYNGTSSGTGYTVNYARKVGCPVINLFESPQLDIEFDI